MDERVRQINNTIDICNHLINTCTNELKVRIGKELFDKCQEFIDKIREWRHKTVLERHLMKYERLCQKTNGGHSNHTGIRAQNKDIRKLPAVTFNLTKTTTTTSGDTADAIDKDKWVINLPRAPLTQVQASLLAHGPGFVVTSKHPPYGDYIVAIEKACNTMEPNSAEELRAEIRGALKHTHPTRSNINREEVQVLAELKRDSSKVILTADKGVALVKMDKTTTSSLKNF